MNLSYLVIIFEDPVRTAL